MASGRTLHVRCTTWEQVEVFHTRKLRRGKLLSMKVPFHCERGTAVTLNLELPNGVIVAIEGTVLKSSPAEPDPKAAKPEAGKTWLEVELFGFTEEIIAQIRRMAAGLPPELEAEPEAEPEAAPEPAPAARARRPSVSEGIPESVPHSLTQGAFQSAPVSAPVNASLSAPPSAPPSAPQSGPHRVPQGGPHDSSPSVPQSGPHRIPQSGPHGSPPSAPQSGPHRVPQSGPHGSSPNGPQSGPHRVPQSGPQSGPHRVPQSGPQSGPHRIPQSGPHGSPPSVPQSGPHRAPQSGLDGVPSSVIPSASSGVPSAPLSGVPSAPSSAASSGPHSAPHRVVPGAVPRRETSPPPSVSARVRQNTPSSASLRVPQAAPPSAPPPMTDERLLDERALFQQLTAELRWLRSVAVHEVLGVSRDADADAIRLGWMALVRRHHPDLVARRNAPAISHLAEEITILVNRAYDRLRVALVAEGRATSVGPVLYPPPGWLVGFDDIASTGSNARGRLGPLLHGGGNATQAGAIPSPPPPHVQAGESGEGGEAFELRARAMLGDGDADNAQEVLAAALCVYPRSRPLRSLYYVASAISALAKGEVMLATSQLETAIAHHEGCREAAAILELLRRPTTPAVNDEMMRLFR